MTDTVDRSHNQTPTSDAESLVEAFERCPGELNELTARTAITLAKQMRLGLDDLDLARKSDTAELRERLAVQELPYKLAAQRLEEARVQLLNRLEAYLRDAGLDRLKNEFGLQVYTKRSSTALVTDLAALPDQYKMTVADIKAIEHALKDGWEIPGVRRIEKTSTIVV